MSNLIVTGASGMLGRALMKELSHQNPIGTALRRVREGLHRLDLCDAEATEQFFELHHPQFIIHAAAERRPDVSQKDPEGTQKLNVEATRRLARLAKHIGAWILYVSTDYVFDGTKPPYAPGDATNPLNFYGETKLAGEHALAAEGPQYAILRTGVLFGQVEFIDESAVTAVFKDVLTQKPTAADNWGQRYPTFVDDVAIVCRQMMEQNLIGTFHWCGNERLTKYEQALAMGELLGLPTAHLRPDPNPPAGAPRPHDCQLDCSDLEDRGIGRRTPFRNALLSSGIQDWPKQA